MRLGFALYPVTDLDAAVHRWRQYGLRVLWWPDEHTVILGHEEGTLAQVMLEDHPDEHRLGPGAVFIVEDVDGFRAEHSALDWVLEPCDVPAGRYAAYADAERAGPAVRVLDLTNDLGERGALFAAPC